jgi:hypothetical protein
MGLLINKPVTSKAIELSSVYARIIATQNLNGVEINYTMQYFVNKEAWKADIYNAIQVDNLHAHNTIAYNEELNGVDVKKYALESAKIKIIEELNCLETDIIIE